MSGGEQSDDGLMGPRVHTIAGNTDVPSADQFTEGYASHIPWEADTPIVREDEKYSGSRTHP